MQTYVNGEMKCGQVRLGNGTCGGEVLNEKYYGEATEYSGGVETTVPAGTGALNADFVLLVAAKNANACYGGV